MILHFYVRFSSRFGQTLFISGNSSVLGNATYRNALSLHYVNNHFWHVSVDIAKESFPIIYKYILRDESGQEEIGFGEGRVISIENKKTETITLIDTWNNSSELKNIFFTKPFQQVFFNKHKNQSLKSLSKKYTHQFKVKAPLLNKNESVCIIGSAAILNEWNTGKFIPLLKNGKWWSVNLDLSGQIFPVYYKYGIYNNKNKQFIAYEEGDNRLLPELSDKKNISIIDDGFVNINNVKWKGAGVAIPVFSLRSKKSFGTGEFTDLKLLVDWAKKTGLKLIQLLPINDTTATYTNKDSYPYSAISAFALHPIFLNIEKVAGVANTAIIKALAKKQKQLNALPQLNYQQVITFKWNIIKELYDLQKETLKNDKSYVQFFKENKHWLIPYAAFCFLRDKYQTVDFTVWKSNSIYNHAAIQRLVSPSQKHYDEIAVHYFAQYHLHLQLKEAVDYAHKNGIAIKGDLPIGVSRNSVEVWTEPDLFNLDQQTGAPPDDFAIKGQNWGFPTYNWNKMEETGFSWWKRRLKQMSRYFDVLRIDHILGFFRMWSILIDAVDGILGRFVPATSIHINELFKRHISFDYHRYCKPFINDIILIELFGDETDKVKKHFLNDNSLKPEFDTQQKVEKYFKESNDFNEKIKRGLFELISNVILLEDDKKDKQHFHFRILMDHTSSFKHLDIHSQQQLKELYNHYFFYQHDNLWKKESVHKLLALTDSTNMLICGEDLGMVPHYVPAIMHQLGILSLEVQRMPKRNDQEFSNPEYAPYMSVVTPGTHDMSTIRAWWTEDKKRTQRFYNNELKHTGNAPEHCETWISKEIILQHLHSPAMWSIFQLQDLLGMSKKLKRENSEEERINNPANPDHYWNYRMHITLEDLIRENEFNNELNQLITDSGR